MKPSKATLINKNVQHTIIQDEFGNTIRTETATKTTTDYDYMTNPIEHAIWMWKYYSGINENLDTPEQNFRPPWNWITPFGSGFRMFNSPKYLVTVVKFGDKTDYIINYRGQVPVFIWYMTLPIVGLAILRFGERESKFILAWVFGSYVPWLVKDIIQPNMCFIHHFQFTAPAICIGIPWFWSKMGGKHWKLITTVHLALAVVFFAFFFPVGLRRTI